MDWLVELDDTKDLPIEGVYGDGPVTKMDASAENIHSKLKKVRDYQVSLTNNLFINLLYFIYFRLIIDFAKPMEGLLLKVYLQKFIFGVLFKP